jgi:hypothetical protein
MFGVLCISLNLVQLPERVREGSLLRSARNGSEKSRYRPGRAAGILIGIQPVCQSVATSAIPRCNALTCGFSGWRRWGSNPRPLDCQSRAARFLGVHACRAGALTSAFVSMRVARFRCLQRNRRQIGGKSSPGTGSQRRHHVSMPDRPVGTTSRGKIPSGRKTTRITFAGRAALGATSPRHPSRLSRFPTS